MKIERPVNSNLIHPSNFVRGEVYQRVNDVDEKAFYLKCDDDYVIQLCTGYLYPLESLRGSSFIYHPNAKLVL